MSYKNKSTANTNSISSKYAQRTKYEQEEKGADKVITEVHRYREKEDRRKIGKRRH